MHNILAFPFGVVLSYAANSWLPFYAVLLHILADSAMPAIVKDGKYYPSHPPLKWFILPIFGTTWNKWTRIGWPVTYPPEFNWFYKVLSPVAGWLLLLFLFCFGA